MKRRTIVTGAIWALGEIRDPRAVKPLARMLSRPIEQRRLVRKLVIEALGRIGGPEAVRTILGVLDGPEHRNRDEHAAAIGALRETDDPRVAASLRSRLDKIAPECREFAKKVIAWLERDRDKYGDTKWEGMSYEELQELVKKAFPQADSASRRRKE